MVTFGPLARRHGSVISTGGQRFICARRASAIGPGSGTLRTFPPLGRAKTGLLLHHVKGVFLEVDGVDRDAQNEASVVSAPADVAAALDIAPDSDVIRRRRVYRDRLGIVAHSTSWIPAEYGRLVPQLAESARLTGGTSLQLIAQATGRPITRRIDAASARSLRPADAKLLELDPSNLPMEPVVIMTAKFIDSAGQVVEYGVDLGGPGRTWLTESEVAQ
ncbi:UTRA domain-containing protein [Streptomyces sp. SH5]|uniref:UTRA domain-containing protein n=1 Tax=Streptomyces sp. SH5 TaxID=3041765 RepID=UPI0024780647|nr:UTRA domain-containing protein [Streptomyces sp. SH5]WGP12665.1 UTRA domain-containing protein [Streptomyces sp. SH5]